LNAYRWSDLHVGLSHELTVTVEPRMMERFRDDTGDDNPLHTDPDFARERGFPGVVAYGMLTASFYSTLVGVHLPGRYALLHGVDASFMKPVFPGDTLTVSGSIVELHEAFRQIEIRAQVTNQRGERVSKAKIKVGLRE
jgi:3-hydroxybutyryl-CoA dehydratase